MHRNKEKYNTIFEKLDVDEEGNIKIQSIIDHLDEFEGNSKRRDRLKKTLTKKKDLKMEYTDFLTKVVDVKKNFTEADLEDAFRYIDSGNKGYIDFDMLRDIKERKGEKVDKTEDE